MTALLLLAALVAVAVTSFRLGVLAERAELVHERKINAETYRLATRLLETARGEILAAANLKDRSLADAIVSAERRQ